MVEVRKPHYRNGTLQKVAIDDWGTTVSNIFLGTDNG